MSAGRRGPARVPGAGRIARSAGRQRQRTPAGERPEVRGRRCGHDPEQRRPSDGRCRECRAAAHAETVERHTADGTLEARRKAARIDAKARRDETRAWVPDELRGEGRRGATENTRWVAALRRTHADAWQDDAGNLWAGHGEDAVLLRRGYGSERRLRSDAVARMTPEQELAYLVHTQRTGGMALDL